MRRIACLALLSAGAVALTAALAVWLAPTRASAAPPPPKVVCIQAFRVGDPNGATVWPAARIDAHIGRARAIWLQNQNDKGTIDWRPDPIIDIDDPHPPMIDPNNGQNVGGPGEEGDIARPPEPRDRIRDEDALPFPNEIDGLQPLRRGAGGANLACLPIYFIRRFVDAGGQPQLNPLGLAMTRRLAAPPALLDHDVGYMVIITDIAPPWAPANGVWPNAGAQAPKYPKGAAPEGPVRTYDPPLDTMLDDSLRNPPWSPYKISTLAHELGHVVCLDPDQTAAQVDPNTPNWGDGLGHPAGAPEDEKDINNLRTHAMWGFSFDKSDNKRSDREIELAVKCAPEVTKIVMAACAPDQPPADTDGDGIPDSCESVGVGGFAGLLERDGKPRAEFGGNSNNPPYAAMAAAMGALVALVGGGWYARRR